jgi:superfamily II DNA or RNA helicase
MELLPYQFEPALALLHGRGSRVLIADDVGLGKTVQAMLAVSELRVRGAASRVLVICPAGLREQWAQEGASRFGLPLAVIDQHSMRKTRAQLPMGVNPWSTTPLAVASIDYVKRPEVLPLVLQGHWDVVIVDEAHGACGQSERHAAVSALCQRAAYVLLLTATPHNGDEAAFRMLCGIGRHHDELIVFRRSRLEAGRDAGRRVHTMRVTASDAERRMHDALAALTRAIRRESADMDQSVWLMLTLLHKRALSSPFSLAASAERRLQLLDATSSSAVEQLLLPLDDGGGELDAADAAPMWGTPALQDTSRERHLLEQVVLAARLAAGSEGKLQRLHRILRSVREPVIVFTEYRDTLHHVRSHVAPHAAIVHGGMTREQRRAALEAFPSVGVLLATDAAGEGLNLQRHCRCVINLELPWNPMRLEQRIGRVDRIGQSRRVHVVHLVSKGTGELSLLDRLSLRLSRAQARVGAPDPLGGRPAWTEDASARLVVLREETDASQAAWTAPPLPLARMQVEAARESSRASSRRVLSGAGPELSPGHAKGDTVSSCRRLIARTRSARTRRALGANTLLLFRTALWDGAGSLVAARVDGVVMQPGTLLPEDPTAVSSQVAYALSSGHSRWHEEASTTHRAMTSRLLDRWRAIAALFPATGSEHQPGLFDRRAEHEWQDAADARQKALSIIEARIARAALALELQLTAPDLMLVLTTRARVRHL